MGNQLKRETQRLNKVREGIHRKLRDVENHKTDVEQQRRHCDDEVACNRSAAFLFVSVIVTQHVNAADATGRHILLLFGRNWTDCQ